MPDKDYGNYKSYRVQCMECDKNGNRFTENCLWCGRPLLICKKYGGQCKSSKCRKERGL